MNTRPVVIVVRADLFELAEDWEYRWTFDAERELPGLRRGPVEARLVIPAGFCFDGASVPRAAHAIIGRLDLGLRAPLCHDWLYHFGGALPPRSHQWLEPSGWVDVDATWYRSESDRLFGRHMREAGVPRWRRRLAYRAVRTFGRRAWGNGGSFPPEVAP